MPHRRAVSTEACRMSARIYRKPANPMQRGRKNADLWILEHDVPYACRADPLTGWQGSGDTRGQISLTFPDRQAAIRFAEREGLAYRLLPDEQPTPAVRPYAANFAGAAVEISEAPASYPPAPPASASSDPLRQER
jgi:hypothetical protein